MLNVRSFGDFGRALCSMSALAALLAVVMPASAQLTPDDIQKLREQGEREGWTFEVAENPATKYPLDQLCGLVVPDKWWEGARFDPCPPLRDLPEAYNWCDLGGCTPVRNQASCGSCWAFATVGPLELNIKIHDGVTVDLSEQWLVSCNSDGWGCDGGWWAHDYHQWKTDSCGDFGAVLEGDFPYVAYDAACNCPYPHPYQIEDWAYIGSDSGIPPTDSMKQAIIDHGPISVAVYANSAMQAYSGGIFNGCSSGTVNHGVVLVGWDDSQGVWIMRNSWGAGWGEGGYIRIPYGCSSIGYAAAYVVYGGALPQLTFEYPDGRPDMLAPNQETHIHVNVLPDTGTPIPGTGSLHYSVNGGGTFTTAMTVLGENQYDAVLPAAQCGDIIDWYVSAMETGGSRIYDPTGAPTNTYSNVVATGHTVVIDDNFETDLGWTVDAGAATGNWERADPELSEFWDWDCWCYVTTQPENDHSASGSRCYVTGAAAGSSAGDYDVDGGPTILTSPVLELAGSDATVSYWRWFHISTELDDSFYVKVSNDGGASWTTVETVSSPQEWTYAEWRVADYVTPTDQVLVRFQIADTDPGSLIEALVDDFKVEATECDGGSDCPEDVDGNGQVGLEDLSLLLASYGLCDGDTGYNANAELTGDNCVDLNDLSTLLSAYGTVCE